MFTTQTQAKRSAFREKLDRANERTESPWILRDSAGSRYTEANRGSDRESSPEPEISAASQAAANEPFVFPSLGEEEEQKYNSSYDLKRLLIGVWQRKILVCVITLVSVLLFLAIAIFLVDKSWTAKSVLIKRVDADQFQIGGGVPFKQQAYNFQTMLDTLMLPSILGSTLESAGIAARPTTLASAVSLIRGRESNLFQIKVTWDDPLVAASLTNNLVTFFLKNNRAMRRAEAEKVFDYYSLQLTDVEAKATDLDRQIQDFQREKSVINFDRQSEITLRAISDIEVRHRSILAELAEIVRNDAQLEARIEETPEMTIQTTLYKSPLKYKLTELEWTLEQLRGRYTDENPKVIEVIDQVNSLRAVIAEGGDQSTPENIYAINPVRESLLMKQIENQDLISIKSAQARALGESLAQSRFEITQLTESQRTYSGLVQERESLSDLLDTLRNRVEEARIMMENNQADFDLVNTAEVPRESNPTIKKLIAVAGAFLGAGFALFVAFSLEVIDPRIKTAREVRGLAGIDRVYEITRLPDDESGWTDPANPDADLAVVIRRILNNLQSELQPEDSQLLAITSLDRGAGRSQIAANLAVASIQKERPTLLIDADLSRSAGTRSTQEWTQVNESAGLGDYLVQGMPLNQTIQETLRPSFRVIGSGTQLGTGRESMLALSGKRMRSLMKKLQETKQQVIIDLPPIGRDESVFELVQDMGRVVLVVQASRTRKKDLECFAQRAERCGIDILGVILTQVEPVFSNESRQFI